MTDKKKKLTIMGRPKKLPQIWNDELKAKILKEYENGGSHINAVVLMDIDRETFYRWKDISHNDKENLTEIEKIEQDFSNTIKKGHALSQIWWEKQGHLGAWNDKEGRNLNNTAWIFNMKNRFREDWKDKVEQEVTNNDQVMVKVNLSEDKE